MAVVTSRLCDVDNAHKDAEQHVFALDGTFFTADLCPADAVKLQKALEPYTKVAAELSAKEALKLTGGTTNGHEVDLQAVRAWAAKQDPPIKVAEKGRIAGDVIEKYLAANPPTT